MIRITMASDLLTTQIPVIFILCILYFFLILTIRKTCCSLQQPSLNMLYVLDSETSSAEVMRIPQWKTGFTIYILYKRKCC